MAQKQSSHVVLSKGYVTTDLFSSYQGYDAIGAIDGRDGVRMFETEGRFECVLDRRAVWVPLLTIEC